MANKSIFNTIPQRAADADTVNNAGGAAYSLSDKEALAQLVMTGTFNNTFYTTASQQVDNVKTLLNKLGSANAEFIAKLAIKARQDGFMKDTPAYLVAWLSVNGPGELFKKAFTQVIDNGKMLRNFVQVMRSGAVGRKSLGSAPKKLVQDWIVNASVNKLLRASVGNAPSLADIIKMVHPRPANVNQQALFKWIIGAKMEGIDYHLLPDVVNRLIDFREGRPVEVMPNVPFELLTSHELSADAWKAIAMNGGWQMIRMNLNTFMRKGILDDTQLVEALARKLEDPEEIARARVMPYQLFTTFLNTSDSSIHPRLTKALESALSVSLQNIPRFRGNTLVFVDVSGSMSSPITGHRSGSTTVMRCVDVAALIASSLLRVNPSSTKVVMFDTRVHSAILSPEASVMQNAKTISRFGGGGTACQLPLQDAVNRKVKADQIIYISDNESWMRTNRWNTKSTETAEAWMRFKKINPNAKMICIDLQPGTTSQVQTDKSVLNVGGFNDSVYKVIDDFISEDGSSDFWTRWIDGGVSL